MDMMNTQTAYITNTAYPTKTKIVSSCMKLLPFPIPFRSLTVLEQSKNFPLYSERAVESDFQR